MQWPLKCCNVFYWLALTVWVSVLASGAVAAAGVFGKLTQLDVTLGAFSQYDPSAHGRLVAGMVMEPIFTFIDLMQFLAGAIVVLALLAQVTVFGMPLRRAANAMRILCIAAAATLLIIRAAIITPSMNHELRAYWAAAQAGNEEAAQSHRAAFDAKHPVVTTMFQATMILLLIAVAASAVALGPQRPRSAQVQMPRLFTIR
jgi:hypothetical protein